MFIEKYNKPVRNGFLILLKQSLVTKKKKKNEERKAENIPTNMV